MRLCLKLILGVLLLVIVLSILTFYIYFRTGGGTWVVQLPGDYVMARLHSDSIVISRKSDGREVIGPPIDEYAVCGHIVVGHVGRPEAGSATQEGYFLIDTRSGCVRKRLSKGAFLRLVSESGLRKEPELRCPKRPM